MKEMTKTYSNGEIDVLWKPDLCIHAGECVKALPNVYDPKAKPWIKVENATTAELKDQIKKCPSGALSYKMVSETGGNTSSKESVQVQVIPDGPLMVSGSIRVEGSGLSESKDKAAFCRCGASENKPFCDGGHKKIGFKG